MEKSIGSTMHPSNLREWSKGKHKEIVSFAPSFKEKRGGFIDPLTLHLEIICMKGKIKAFSCMVTLKKCFFSL
jgi:hypothetical protein